MVSKVALASLCGVAAARFAVPVLNWNSTLSPSFNASGNSTNGPFNGTVPLLANSTGPADSDTTLDSDDPFLDGLDPLSTIDENDPFSSDENDPFSEENPMSTITRRQGSSYGSPAIPSSSGSLSAPNSYGSTVPPLNTTNPWYNGTAPYSNGTASSFNSTGDPEDGSPDYDPMSGDEEMGEDYPFGDSDPMGDYDPMEEVDPVADASDSYEGGSPSGVFRRQSSYGAPIAPKPYGSTVPPLNTSVPSYNSTNSTMPSNQTASPFTAVAHNADNGFTGQAINAASAGFYIGAATSAYCPSAQGLDCSLFPGNDTVFISGNGTVGLDVGLPGGQTVFVDGTGALGFTLPHSAAMPVGASTGGFALSQTAGTNAVTTLRFEDDDFLACPTGNNGTTNSTRFAPRAAPVYQIYAKGRLADNGTCLEFEMAIVSDKGLSAWEYV